MPDFKLLLGAGVGGSSLNTGLLAAWNFDNTPGNLVDSGPSGLTLTNNAVATFGTGQIGQCATFVRASSQYLSLAAGSGPIITTGDLTIACWVNFATKTSNMGIMMRANGSNTGYGLLWNAGSVGYQFICGDASAHSVSAINSSVNPTNGTWHFIVGQFIASSHTGQVSVDNGSFTTNVNASLVEPTDPNVGLTIGRWDSVASNFLDGSVDAALIYSRAITAAEITTLYNAGTGRQPPF